MLDVALKAAAGYDCISAPQWRITLSCLPAQVSAAAQEVRDDRYTPYAALGSICDQLQLDRGTSDAPTSGDHFASLLMMLLMLQPRNLCTQVAAAVLSFVQFDATADMTAYELARQQGECFI